MRNIPDCVLHYDSLNNSIKRHRVSCNVSPSRRGVRSHQSSNQSCNSFVPSASKNKASKKPKPLCKERKEYTEDLKNIEITNSGSELGKPETFRKPYTCWKVQEQKAWLLTYMNFLDKKQLTKESCKWKFFARDLKDNYGVDKDNVQCAKQVF